jgi:hypothetical protein
MIAGMANERVGMGQLVFPQQEEPGGFPAFGNEEVFEKASRGEPLDPDRKQIGVPAAPRYDGSFLIDTCLGYDSSVVVGKYRTGQAFYLSKRTHEPIDLKGETLNAADLMLAPSTLYASDVQ